MAEASKSIGKRQGPASSSMKLEKRNGFSMFMEVRKPEVLASGHKLTRGRYDLAQLLSDEWKALSAEKKAEYAQLAKEHNERCRRQRGLSPVPSDTKKVNAAPPPPSHKRVRPAKEDELVRGASEPVDKIFKALDWRKQRIVIGSFSVFLDEEEFDENIPAEIGLTTMSLEEGICDMFGRIIDPGEGCFVRVSGKMVGRHVAESACKRLSIPLSGTLEEFQDLAGLLTITADYLESHRRDLEKVVNGLPVFFFDSDLKTAQTCFEWLSEKSGVKVPVKLLSLNRFVYLACRQERPICDQATCDGCSVCENYDPSWISPLRSQKKALTPVYAYPENLPKVRSGIFEKSRQAEEAIKEMDNYRHLAELSCIYHYKLGEGVYNCALVASNRYAYGLLETLTLSNTVEIVPGRHHPHVDKPLMEGNRRLWMLREWGVTAYEESMKVSEPGLDDTEESSEEDDMFEFV